MKPSAIWRATAFAGALMIAAVVIPTQTSAEENEDENVSVSMSTRVARAPATVRLNVRVPPRAANRLLRVTLDSGGYYRSSDLPLEGDQAAAVQSVRWPGIPSGTYTVFVELFRSNGTRRLVHTGRLDVIGF